VAVLPFVNMSGDADEEYFADGISEQLLNTLSRIDELQVAGQTSSFSFKGKDVGLATVARKLNVSTILEGSVRRSGQTVRITAQLISSTTGFQLWSQTYDRSIRDTLTVQSEIANSVARALKITLLGRVAELAAEAGTHDERALDAYLRSLKLEGTVRSAEEARATIEAYSEALRFDPHFALAYSARARADLDYTGYFMNEATRATFERARADAERAVAIAPDLGETHSALGETLEVGFLDFGRAIEEHSRALTLAPGSAQVLRAYSHFMAYMGHADAAIAAARRNAALDPLNVLAFRILGETLQAARRYPEAIAAYDQAIRLNPGHASEVYQHRGRSEYLLGNFEMAKASCEVEPAARAATLPGHRARAQVCWLGRGDAN
jgi:TolB-like protein